MMSRERKHMEYEPISTLPEAVKLERNIMQMRDALRRIRDEAATKENGGEWAAGLANLCLATLHR
jgi:hypothetical protein